MTLITSLILGFTPLAPGVATSPPTHLTLPPTPQAEVLGNLFRNVMYPPSAGGGLLRLHSTYRHDLKIYSSGAWGWGGNRRQGAWKRPSCTCLICEE